MPQNVCSKLSASFCALLRTLLLVTNKYIPSDSFLVGSNPEKFNEDSNNFFTFSFSLLDIFTIGTIAIFCRNMLYRRMMLRIVPCFDNDWIPYRINRNFELTSLDIMRNKFFNILALLGDVRISYANVVTLSFPFSSPTSLLYKSKAGITIFSC